MSNLTLPKKKEFDPDKCPHCKVLIKDINKLQYKIMYRCGKCNGEFFIEKCPRYYFT